MANTKSSTQETQSARPPVDMNPTPSHRPFSWLSIGAESDPSAQFAARIMDIAAGTKVIAQIMRSHAHDLRYLADGSPGVVPLMSDNDIDALAGLAAVALDDLYDMAAAQVACLEKGATA